jgi:hypothetical protein
MDLVRHRRQGAMSGDDAVLVLEVGHDVRYFERVPAPRGRGSKRAAATTASF